MAARLVPDEFDVPTSLRTPALRLEPIAERHHVSHRVAVRALEILKGEGMIVNVPGEGEVVRHPRT